MAFDLSCENILHSIYNGVIVCDAEGRIAFVNEPGGKILKPISQEFLGAFIADILPVTGEWVLKCLQSGKPQLGRHVHGRNLRMVVNITPMRREENIIGAVCSFQLMGEFEQAARRLKSYENLNRQLNAVFQLSSDGIWLSDGEGTVLRINKAAEKIIGLKASEVEGRNLRALLEEGLIDHSVTLTVLAKKRKVHMMQYVSKTKKHLLLSGTPLFDDKGEIAMVVVNERDITQLNALKEKLQQTRLITEKFKDELAELSLQEVKKEGIVAESQEMKHVLSTALKLAKLEASNILLLGESGTGKGLLAKYIHMNSKRRDNPFIQINFAAVPETLLEAELFGYEPGAFTGAGEKGKAGLFELAQGGTLFLDEIAEASPSAQAKILKYLDDQQVLRVGGTKPKNINCTIIAATNRNLEALVKSGGFRRDLFYRLDTFTLYLPPLRERPDDIFELVGYYLDRYNRRYGQQGRITSRGLKLLQSHPFYGNVRELKSLIKKAVVMSQGDLLDKYLIESLSEAKENLPKAHVSADLGQTLEEALGKVEKQLLKKALSHCRSTRDLARYLGVSQPTVVRKLRKHKLAIKRFNKKSHSKLISIN